MEIVPPWAFFSCFGVGAPGAPQGERREEERKKRGRRKRRKKRKRNESIYAIPIHLQYKLYLYTIGLLIDILISSEARVFSMSTHECTLPLKCTKKCPIHSFVSSHIHEMHCGGNEEYCYIVYSQFDQPSIHFCGKRVLSMILMHIPLHPPHTHT